MGETTKIQWCDHTFNHVRGCTKVSAGCAHCYADSQAKRSPGVLGVWGPNGTRVVASEAKWKEPLKWNRAAVEAGERRRVFCASMADVFENWKGIVTAANGAAMYVCNECGAWRTMETMCCGPNAHFPLTLNDVRARLFRLIDATPNLDWQLLTKRPENVARMLPEGWHDDGSFPNVWFGASVEDQAAADERIPHLLRVPAAVRFLSVEPLLGPVDLSRWLRCESCLDPSVCWCSDARINWVIVGGESGHDARPCRVEWVRGVVRQCQAAGAPVFVKQLGADYQDAPNGVCGRSTKWPLDVLPSGPSLRLADPKGGSPEEWPEDLRVREFPRPTA